MRRWAALLLGVYLIVVVCGAAYLLAPDSWRAVPVLFGLIGFFYLGAAFLAPSVAQRERVVGAVPPSAPTTLRPATPCQVAQIDQLKAAHVRAEGDLAAPDSTGGTEGHVPTCSPPAVVERPSVPQIAPPSTAHPRRS